MNVTSLSFTYLQVSAASGVASTRPAASGAPSPAPQAVARDDCRCADDKPRRSPFVRALKEALLEVAASVKAESTTPASAAPAAGSEAVDPADDAGLSDALMDFARALMQSLREQGGSRAEREHGHRHQRHGHGHAQWGDPAQRVDALAQQLASPAPAPAPVGGTSPEPVVGSAPQASTEPVAAVATTASAEAAAVGSAQQSKVVVVSLRAAQQAEASPFAGLLEAFAKLQKALGKGDDDGSALPKALSEFLQSLAAKLRGEALPSVEAATEPGALIDVAA